MTMPPFAMFIVLATITYLQFLPFVSCRSGNILFVQTQCKAKCLSFSPPEIRHSRGTGKSITQLSQNRPIHDPCFDNLNKKDCDQRQCMIACEKESRTCLQECTNSPFCRRGCSFLASLLTNNRPGSCPLSTTTGGLVLFSMGLNSPMCPNDCSIDTDCFNALYKCCPTQCGYKCVKPNWNDTIPPLAPKLMPVLNASNNKVSLDWVAPYKSIQTPSDAIVFILEIRYCICQRFVASYMSDWQMASVTHYLGARLDAFDKGKVYQFRLAAVSAAGTRGFGPASEPYPNTPPPPQPPRPPRNVTDGMWRIYAGGKISVTITWAQPEQSDLPISEYKIMWVHDHGYVQSDGNSLEGLTKYVQSVSPSRRRHVIENLDPTTSYKVQVYAESSWLGRDYNLVSQPNTIFISTPSLRPAKKPAVQRKSQVTKHTSDPPGSNCRCREISNSKSKIEVLKPKFYHGELTVKILLKTVTTGGDIPYNVYWAREVCIDTQENTLNGDQGVMKGVMKQRLYRLTKLSFNCRYSVRLEPLDSSSSSIPRIPSTEDIQTCFCTPSCGDVQVAPSFLQPRCAYDGSRLPASPSALNSQLIDRAHLTYRLSWQPPAPAEGDPPSSRPARQSTTHPLLFRPPVPLAQSRDQGDRGGEVKRRFSRYRVVWGPRQKEPVNKEMYNDAAGFTPILDFRHSDVRVLPINVTSLTLPGLQRATFYIVRVQTLSIDPKSNRETESATAVHYFTTLGFRNPDTPKFIPGSAEVAKFIKSNSSTSAVFASLRTLLTLTLVRWTISLILHRD